MATIDANYTRCLCESCANEQNYRSSKYVKIYCYNCCAECTRETMRDFKCFICRCSDYLDDPQIFEDRAARKKEAEETELREAEERAAKLRKEMKLV